MNRKRNVLFFVLMMVLSLLSPLCAEAQSIPEERQLPRIVDNGAVLTDAEEASLLAKVDEISERQQCDVAIVTVESLEGKTVKLYADDFYDFNGYGMGEGDDGVLLLVSMNDRKWAITTYGKAIPTFTSAGLSYLEDQFRPLLTDGEYAQAFTVFAEQCDDYITQAASGTPYDTGNMPRGTFPFLTRLVMALAIGVIIAFVVVSHMKSQLKSVGFQKAAAAYEKQGSMNVTNRSDLFLYRNVSRRRKPKQSSGGGGMSTGSSGRSHGGSSGSF